MSESSERKKPVDIPITAEEFRKFREFFLAKVGMDFAENKRYFVDSRLAERARQVGCRTFREYFQLLRVQTSGAELEQLINLLTVNETYFFRESDQFTSLVEGALPEIAARKRPGDTIRIWSLPCSTGEEPYSIAMFVLDSWSRSDEFRIDIHGSDIDTRVLVDAKAGIYGERSLQRTSREVRERYFRRHGEDYEIIPELRGSIDFTQINICDTAAMARWRDIDAIFCRNMLIYFDDDARRDAVAALYESLAPGGFLFLGHSESMHRMSTRFTDRRLGECVVYQRPYEDD